MIKRHLLSTLFTKNGLTKPPRKAIILTTLFNGILRTGYFPAL